MLRDLGKSAPVIRLLYQQLNIPLPKGFVKTITEPKLAESMAGVIDPQLIQNIATGIGQQPPETEQVLINLALNASLLPREVLDAIGEKVTLDGIEDLASSKSLIKNVQSHEGASRTTSMR